MSPLRPDFESSDNSPASESSSPEALSSLERLLSAAKSIVGTLFSPWSSPPKKPESASENSGFFDRSANTPSGMSPKTCERGKVRQSDKSAHTPPRKSPKTFEGGRVRPIDLSADTPPGKSPKTCESGRVRPSDLSADTPPMQDIEIFDGPFSPPSVDMMTRINEILNNEENLETLVRQIEDVPITRRLFKSLEERNWLNDEIITTHMIFLQHRDAELCREDPLRKPSHYFHNFFVNKLIDCGGYNYENVKRYHTIYSSEFFSYSFKFFLVNIYSGGQKPSIFLRRTKYFAQSISIGHTGPSLSYSSNRVLLSKYSSYIMIIAESSKCLFSYPTKYALPGVFHIILRLGCYGLIVVEVVQLASI